MKKSVRLGVVKNEQSSKAKLQCSTRNHLLIDLKTLVNHCPFPKKTSIDQDELIEYAKIGPDDNWDEVPITLHFENSQA